MKSYKTKIKTKDRNLVIIGFVVIGIIFVLYSNIDDFSITPDSIQAIERLAIGFYTVLLMSFGVIGYGIFRYHQRKSIENISSVLTIIAKATITQKSKKICVSLSKKIKKKFKSIDLILSPAMGGIVIGYEIGRLLNRETIFCERVKKKFTLRRGFFIKKNTKVLIVEDVITTGKSSLECLELVKANNADIVGFACIIDRSNGKSKIKDKIISQVKLDIPTYKKENLPKELEFIEAVKPGSRNL